MPVTCDRLQFVTDLGKWRDKRYEMGLIEPGRLGGGVWELRNNDRHSGWSDEKCRRRQVDSSDAEVVKTVISLKGSLMALKVFGTVFSC